MKSETLTLNEQEGRVVKIDIEEEWNGVKLLKE